MSAKDLQVELTPDHLERLAQVGPTTALLELCWNALDADATNVSIEFVSNQLDGITEIHFSDDGHGISEEDAKEGFGHLGASWKKEKKRTRITGRRLHGKNGEGRYTAFRLGHRVTWNTTFGGEDGHLYDRTITGANDHIERFRVGEPTPSSSSQTGTTVVITALDEKLSNPRADSVRDSITGHLAPYLEKYPDINVFFDGERIDPASLQEDSQIHPLPSIESHAVSLKIVEWKKEVKRQLYLCDYDGISLREMAPGIQAKNWNFTAYLQTEYIRELVDRNALDIGELDPKLNAAVDDARTKLREAYNERQKAKKSRIIQQWRDDGIYPYSEDPSTAGERATRMTFDRLALEVNENLSDFKKSSTEGKQFILMLLRQALESNPESVRKVMTEVLNLPKKEMNDLARLLDKTSLVNIITASKEITNRLEFLQGLKYIIFEPEVREQLKERTQLHKILEPNMWLFGEEYHLTASDKSLTNCLREHLRILGRDADVDDPVLRPSGKTGIVDLMLSKVRKTARADELEHLVVELKRPTQKVDRKVMEQIYDYAMAVVNDQRYEKRNIRWDFWAISNQIDPAAREYASQPGRPDGLYYESREHQFRVWAKSWAEIIADCQAGLEFYQSLIGYSADEDDGVALLKESAGEYLPESMTLDEESAPVA